MGFPALMVAPALLTLAVVIGFPIVKGLILSFQMIKLTSPATGGDFTLYNYVKMFSDKNVLASVWRSCVYMSGSVLGATFVGLIAALLTRRAFMGRSLFRTFFILPWAIPAVATTLVWGVMYDANFGVMNRIVQLLPGINSNIEWLIDRDYVLGSLIAVQIWGDFPVAYLFLLAGLQAIPEELYEAANVDGANGWQQFWHITAPQLRYIVTVTIILLGILSFRSFAVIHILTGGGPNRRTETLVIQTYNAAFRSFDFSYGAALGILSLIFSVVIVALYIRLTLGREMRGAAAT
ncbi:sugar ABC transporter permease [Shinella daejeonensis]|uniref:carbohydrate ABC transporter permease n=1 Tax=Shinella daejeonensis TaxID=659017 RepID=UPI0020C80C18|nr:sugar ABC transporter permease [Shinella daejeonensis]MCP8894829.1 sugar ABC transporter permease [Shinella daejeonensis]